MEVNPIVRGTCFMCKTVKYLEEKPMRDNGRLCRNYLVCPTCGASNSKNRLEQEIKLGKAKRIT